MIYDHCPACGWVVDYSCGCPSGPTFPLVPRDRDGSGEAGETTQLARPEGQQPGPKASPTPSLPLRTPTYGN